MYVYTRVYTFVYKLTFLIQFKINSGTYKYKHFVFSLLMILTYKPMYDIFSIIIWTKMHV